MGGLKLDLKKYLKNPMCLGVGAAVCVLAVIVLVVILLPKNKEEDKREIVTKASLEKIIDVSDLSTFEAVYNGIAKVMNDEESEKVDYYVYYEATVKAGIDFEKIDIEVDNEAKTVSVKLPNVSITKINVDIGSLDFMFENDKANTDAVSEQAYKACIADVENESAKETAIKELATENAKNIVEALIKPFVAQLDAEYVLEIE